LNEQRTHKSGPRYLLKSACQRHRRKMRWKGAVGGELAHCKPPVYLKPADTVSVTVEGLGTLTNPVLGP